MFRSNAFSKPSAWVTNNESWRKQKKKEEKYRKTSLYRMKKEINVWWSRREEYYYHYTDLNKEYVSYFSVDPHPFTLIEELKDEIMKITAFAVHQDFRNRGIGDYLFKGLCRDADKAGCCLYLVAKPYEVSFSNEPEEHIRRLKDYGIGFSELYSKDEIRKGRRKLQSWYMNEYDFQRCNSPTDYCYFENKYLEKKAQLIRIPDTASPEVKEQLKKYLR